jgi:hypothetical protein
MRDAAGIRLRKFSSQGSGPNSACFHNQIALINKIMPDNPNTPETTKPLSRLMKRKRGFSLGSSGRKPSAIANIFV